MSCGTPDQIGKLTWHSLEAASHRETERELVGKYFMVLEAVASFVVALMKHTYNSGTKIIEHVWKRRRPFPRIITSGFEWSIKQPQLQTCISATSHLSLVSWGPLIGHSLFMTFVRLPA